MRFQQIALRPQRPRWQRDKAFLLDVVTKRYTAAAALDLDLQRAFFSEIEGVAPRDRRRYVFALVAIAKHMQAIGLPADIAAELLELSSALLDLDEGRVRPMLERNVPGGKGRPPDSRDVWSVRVLLAIAVELLVQNDGERRLKKTAVSKVALRLGPLGDVLLSGTKGTFSGALAKWHQDLTSRVGCPVDAQRSFDTRQDLIDSYRRQYGQLSDAEVAEHILSFALLQASRTVDADTMTKLAQKLRRKGRT